MGTHALWAPSSFDRRQACPGSMALEEGLPDTNNVYSAEGTAAHQLLAWVVDARRPASDYIGEMIHVASDGEICGVNEAEWSFEVDEDMASAVQVTANYAYDLAGEDGQILTESRVCFADFVGVDRKDGEGTADLIVLRPDLLGVIDLKYGRGVGVDATDNGQLGSYGLGVVDFISTFADVPDRILMAISQPRITHAPDIWEISKDELLAWAKDAAKPAVTKARMATLTYKPLDEEWEDLYLNPGESQCKFCKAKTSCRKIREDVFGMTFTRPPSSPEDFDSPDVKPLKVATEGSGDWLAAVMKKADYIEDYVTAVRAEVLRRLVSGIPVKDHKLVQGRAGNRKWLDAQAAEQMLKDMRVKEQDMYDRKVISPTTAEKLYKAGTIGPRQWPKLAAAIIKPPGALHVAPESDKRPAVSVEPVADGFDAAPTEPGEEFA